MKKNNFVPVISLLTDFGLADPYVGIMKGVIVSICPYARIIDLCHQVRPQNISQAAFMIASCPGFFPPHTVHVAVVDPGVGSKRAIVALKTNSGIYLAPDNGILSFVLGAEPDCQAWEVKNSDFFLSPLSRTFHGRDIFAPVAARLASGMDMDSLGPQIDPGALIRIDPAKGPQIDKKGVLSGLIIYVDGFGNLITDITGSDLDNFLCDPSELVIKAGKEIIYGLSPSYSTADKGKVLAIMGSARRLEISVNHGNAAEILGLGEQDPVFVSAAGSGNTIL